MRTEPLPILNYSHPMKNTPQWYVNALVFQNGNPRLKRSSLTGGGQLFVGAPSGTFRPVVYVHSSVTTSLLGSGIQPWNAPFLTNLGENPGGNNGNGI